MRNRSLLTITTACLMMTLPAYGGAMPLGGVPRPLFLKLNRGLNIAYWFCKINDSARPARYRGYLSGADMEVFKRLHVTWLRLCLAPESIYQAGHPNQINLRYLDAAVNKLNRAGLAVVLDLHDQHQLALDQDGGDPDGFISFWEGIARHYRGVQEDNIIFELLNEPSFKKNRTNWYSLQQRAVWAIRKIDPSRTIMVTPNHGSDIDSLVEMQPLRASNLLYTFHCYDPFDFTHQGANWVADPPRGLKSMPFPSSPNAVGAALAQSSPSDASTIRWYGEQKFDASYLEIRLAKAYEWGATNHVPVVMGEFGANPQVAPAGARARWFKAMKEAIQDLKMPAAIWAYDDALGLGRKRTPNGAISLDGATLQSLYGLQIGQ